MEDQESVHLQQKAKRKTHIGTHATLYCLGFIHSSCMLSPLSPATFNDMFVKRKKMLLRQKAKQTKILQIVFKLANLYEPFLSLHTLGQQLFFPTREKKEERRSDHRFHLIRPSSRPLAPSSASNAVQLDAQSWMGWSRCLGRADIFETLLP